MTEDREVDMSWSPVIHPVRPGIGAWFDCLEGVKPVFICYRSAASAKVGIKRSDVTFFFMAVASASIGLPEFEQRASNADPALIQHPAMDQNPLANCHFARLGEVDDQIVVVGPQNVVPENRTGQFGL